MTARLGVFLSGSGRTLENLITTIARGALDATVPVVVASRECRGAEIARNLGIDTRVIEGTPTARQVESLAQKHELDWIVLAGYLKLLPIPELLTGRVVNIHPALLPDFGGPGMHGMKVHQAVAAAAKEGRITETGCTVHLCDAQFDTGPIVLQKRCPVAPDDTPDDIAARVFALEQQAYPEALSILISGSFSGNAPPDHAE
ncbi:MAG: formyltransferase family protein [Phycisphaerales bacterium]